MHNAPPVVYPVGRFVWGAWIVGGLALVGAAVLLVWQTSAQHDGLHIGGAWLLWCVSLFAAVVSWAQESSCSGLLVWNGEDWFWRDASDAEIPVRVQVLLDAGRLMILSCAGLHGRSLSNRRAQFAVLHHASMPSFWHGFRCAVYSRPMDDPVSTPRRSSRFEM
jgi:hypothetical protein